MAEELRSIGLLQGGGGFLELLKFVELIGLIGLRDSWQNGQNNFGQNN